MKRFIMALVAGLILAASVTAYAGIVDNQVDRNAAISMSKIGFPKFATVTDGSAPTAAAYLALTKRALVVGDIIQKTGTALYYKCTSTTGPAWKLVGGSYSDTDGTAALPAHSFPSDPNTGLYWVSADAIGFSAGGTLRLTLNATTGLLTSTLPLVLPVGSAAAPALYFTGDTNSGLYWVGADSIGVATNGAVKFTVASTINTSANVLSVPVGTSAAPGLYFGADVNTGISAAAANTLILSADGASNTLTLESGALTSTEYLALPAGLVGTPAVYFGTAATGLYSAAATSVDVATTGALRLTIADAAVTSTVPVALPVGAIGASSLYFTGDVDTGLWSGGAATMNVNVAGADVVNFTAATMTIPTGVDLAIATGGDLTIADDPTAGTDAANKNYVDGIQETVLAKGAAIECNTSTDQLLYTVATGKTAVVTKVILRAPSVAQAANLAGGFGFGAGGTGWGTFVAQAGFDGATKYFIVTPGTGASVPALGASDTLFYLNSTTEAGVACTATADVIGYTY